jgi:outer membrane biosynthesis protein TonB
MSRPAASLLVLALCAATASGLAACGEEDAQLLPGGTAREITANLETVERLADEGDCAGAESAALQVSEQVEALEGVDPRLERALRDGAERLNEVVGRCEEEVEPVEPVEPSEEVPDEADEDLEKEEEKRAKQEERDRDQEEREDEDGRDDEEEESPDLPPQSEGEGRGLDEADDSPPGGEGGPPDGGSPAGGVSPANPAGEGG